MNYLKERVSSVISYWKGFNKGEKLASIALLALVLFGFINIFFISAPSSFESGNTFKIEKGETLNRVSKDLESLGYIKSKVFFKIFVVLFNGPNGTIAGDYFFQKRLNSFDLAKRIATGKFGLIQQKVTIPEGLTNEQIADIYAQKFSLFDKDVFLKNAHFGKLFPDTYFFLPNVSSSAVIERMEENFDLKMKEIDSDFRNTKRNFNEILIMASILEEEAKTETERKLVSGILWKRYDIGMALQVDPAPETYERRGLPDEPISNPGLEAILDAIYPTKSKYLYYLSDLKGKIYYAKDFEEHQRNRELYFKK